MGNNNSSENTRTTNYKTRKIVGKDKHSGWVRYYLDDYVEYSNGSYKYIDFELPSTGYSAMNFFVAISGGPSEMTSFGEGYYLSIDFEDTKRVSSSHNFTHSRYWIAGMETIDSDGKVSIWASTRELCEEIIECRQRYVRAAAYSHWVNQTQQWTSRDI